MEAILEPLIRSPRLRLYVDELTETLRREQAERERFRASLTEDVRAEFINGEVVEHMTTRDAHTATVQYLVRLLSAYVDLRQLGTVRSEQSLSAFTRNDYLPDVCFWRREKAEVIVPKQLLYPVPDFICEVLSESTDRRDRGVKFDDYAAHGVQEYWIADPEACVIEPYQLKDGRYESAGQRSDGDVASVVVAGFTMPVAAAFDNKANLTALRRVLEVQS